LDRDLCWILLYTKPRAESWAEINLRKQGFVTLLPRVRQRSGFAPLFPRYLFVGFPSGMPEERLRSTRGVLYVVHCGAKPARVPLEVVAAVQSRMDARGIVILDEVPRTDPLFAKAQRERVRALIKFAQAGFRVVA
jgi:transcription antitermination factor NusG